MRKPSSPPDLDPWRAKSQPASYPADLVFSGILMSYPADLVFSGILMSYPADLVFSGILMSYPADCVGQSHGTAVTEGVEHNPSPTA